MSDGSLLGIRVLLDCFGVVILIFVLYVILYYIKRFMVERWIKKAVNAAEKIFIAPKHSHENSLAKKEWVLSFLKDNGLTAGVSDEVVDVLIESEVTELSLKQGKR